MKLIVCSTCTMVLVACSFDPSGFAVDDDRGQLDAGANERDASDGMIDARAQVEDAATLTDATSCADVCPGTCVDDVCEIDCSGPVDCSDDIVCPAGFDCVVNCGVDDCSGAIVCGEGVGRCTIGCGARSCSGAIECAAEDCVIDCIGNDACAGSIDCGPGACNVTCLSAACGGAVDCSASCGCNVYCLGSDNCASGSACPGQCETPTNGCTTFPPGCYACPP